MAEAGIGNKGKVMDGFLTNLVAKIEKTKTSNSNDQLEIRKIETEMKVLQSKIEKATAAIEHKKKLREETKLRVKQLDSQFTEVGLIVRTTFTRMHADTE
jgi:peptidoglycan hydrolase CwlO-like protein